MAQVRDGRAALDHLTAARERHARQHLSEALGADQGPPWRQGYAEGWMDAIGVFKDFVHGGASAEAV